MSEVVFGVDSHKETLAVCGVDQAGRELCAASFPNTRPGHARLIGWARARAGSRRFGIEGAGGLGRAVAQHLLTLGESVAEVPTALTERQRRHTGAAGKSDATDALAIARVTLRERQLPRVVAEGPADELKLLVDHREDLVSERTRVVNRLHADLVALEPGYQAACPNLRALRHLRAAAALIADRDGVHPQIARERIERALWLEHQINRLERQIQEKVDASGTSLTTLTGCGTIVAARIIGEVRDISRFSSRDRFAAHAGTAPVPASSGKTIRHRLSRGGNRRLNRAIQTIARVQSRLDPRGRAYVARRRAEGKTWREAIRCLARHLADVVYRQLRADAARLGAPIPLDL